MNFFKKLHRIFNLFFTKLVISKIIRKRADRYFKLTLKEWVRKNHRNPNRNEMFTEIVVKTSHRVIGLKKSRELRLEDNGHNIRQWIRKYLLLNYRIRDNYKIQKRKSK